MGLFIVNIHGDIEGDYEIIKQIPSADVRENIHGKWIVKGQELYCSKCKKESAYNAFGASRFSDFCPNCGADMRKE